MAEESPVQTNEEENQHFVSKMLLKGFTDRKGLLHFFDKNSPENDVQETSPDEFCVRKNIYTRYDKHGNRDVSVEKNFNRLLESPAAGIIGKIRKSARGGKRPELGLTEKKHLLRLLVCQRSRTPDRSEPIVGRNFMIRCIEDEKFRNLPREERERFREKCKHEFHTRYLTNPNEALRYLEDKEFVIGGIASQGKEVFITGSNPVAITKSEDLETWWLPVAHNTAFGVRPFSVVGVDSRVKFEEVQDHHVRSINKAVFEESEKVAGNSKEPVRRIAIECGWLRNP